MKNIVAAIQIISIFLLTLLLIELFLFSSHIVQKPQNDYVPELGRCRRANMNYTKFNEGFSMGFFNAGRYLNEYYPPEKDTAALRVALLGDSYVEGFQLFDRSHFRLHLENSFISQTGMSLQVLNFGRSGFDIEDMYVYQKTLVEKYNPDYIFYFIDDDDLIPVASDLLFPSTRIFGDSIFVDFGGIDRIYRDKFLKWKDYVSLSSTFSMLNQCRKLILEGYLWPKLLDKFYQTENTMVHHSPARNMDIPINTILIINKLSEDKRCILVKRQEQNYTKTAINLFQTRGLTVFDLGPTLKELKDSGTNPYSWNLSKVNGHWNHEAHRAIGENLSLQLHQHINPR